MMAVAAISPFMAELNWRVALLNCWVRRRSKEHFVPIYRVQSASIQRHASNKFYVMHSISISISSLLLYLYYLYVSLSLSLHWFFTSVSLSPLCVLYFGGVEGRTLFQYLKKISSLFLYLYHLSLYIYTLSTTPWK
jgi:hypothetical protein